MGKRYSLLGWLVWRLTRRQARRRWRRTRMKLGAAALVGLVLAAGAAAAREVASDD